MICAKPTLSVALLLVVCVSGLALPPAGCQRRSAVTAAPGSPQAAAVAFFDAIDKFQSDELKKAFSGEANPAFVNALAAQLKAVDELRQAAGEALGKEAAKAVEADAGPRPSLKDAFAGTTSAQAEGAYVTLQAAGTSMKLKNEQGGWKVVSYGKTNDPGSIEKATAALTKLATSINELTQKVKAGQYQDRDKDIKPLRNEIAQRLAAALQ